MLRSILLVSLVLICISLLTSPAIARDWTSQARAEKIYQDNLKCIERFDNQPGGIMVTGESFGWHLRYSLSGLIRGYEAYGDVIWLECAEDILDQAARRMAVGPDGYKGFIGPFIYNGDYLVDSHVGDAAIFEMMMEFSEIVLTDPTLAPRFADKARYFIALTEKHLIEKWDARGTWYEDGPVGGYRSWNIFATPEYPDKWQPALADTRFSKIALPINKSMHIANSCLILNRLTGKQKYLDKAEKIFNSHRLHIQKYQDCYVWNYWEPQIPSDLDREKIQPLHWVNTHPYRNYQAGEVSSIIRAYDMGIVYTKEDIEAIIRTNLRIMFNGDMENPAFGNSNVTLPGYKAPGASKAYPTWAGALWTPLARFDPTIRELYHNRMSKINCTDGNVLDDLEKAYYQRVTAAKPVSFERRYRPDAKVEPMPMPDSGGQVCATAIPMNFKVGETTTLVGKLPVTGNVRVEVRRVGEGLQRIETLFEGEVKGGFDGMSGFFFVDWDGSIDGKITPGKYTASWFYNGGRRDYPLNILPAN